MRYFKPQRSHYIPAGSIKVADKHSDAVAYLYTTKAGKPGAVVFVGTQQKPISHCYYSRMETRTATVARIFEGRKAAMAYKAEARKARTEFVHSYKVGDLFRTSWGYEQTNVEFFQVTEVKGKHLVLREIAAKVEETGFMQGKCSPQPGKFLEPRFEGDKRGLPIRRLAQNGRVKICDVRTAWPCTAETSASWSSYH